MKPLDRYRKDSTLFQFTTRRLRDFIDPDHLLIRIDEQFDFARLVAPPGGPLLSRQRPTRHPPRSNGKGVAQLLFVQHLLLQKIEFRHRREHCLSLVLFPHPFSTSMTPSSTTPPSAASLSGSEGRAPAIFQGLNEELLRLGLLSPEMYADSSLVKANVNSHRLFRSGLTVEEFREQAIEENGLFVLNESGLDEGGVAREETRYFQDSKGLLPLSPVDTDARWRTSRPGKPPGLNYQDNAQGNASMDRVGFILSRGVTHASEGEWQAVPRLSWSSFPCSQPRWRLTLLTMRAG